MKRKEEKSNDVNNQIEHVKKSKLDFLDFNLLSLDNMRDITLFNGIQDWKNLGLVNKEMRETVTNRETIQRMVWIIVVPAMGTHEFDEYRIPDYMIHATKMDMTIPLATEYITLQVNDKDVRMGKNWDPQDMRIEIESNGDPHIIMKPKILAKYESLVTSMVKKLPNITHFDFKITGDKIFQPANILFTVLSANPMTFQKLQQLDIESSSLIYIIPHRTNVESIFIQHTHYYNKKTIIFESDAPSKENTPMNVTFETDSYNTDFWLPFLFKCNNMNRVTITFDRWGVLRGTLSNTTYVNLNQCIFHNDCKFNTVGDLEIPFPCFFVEAATSPFTAVGRIILKYSFENEEDINDEINGNGIPFSTWCLGRENVMELGFRNLKIYQDEWNDTLIEHLTRCGVNIEFFE